MAKLFIPIISGTIRPGNYTSKAANFVFEESKKIEEIETILLKPDDFNLPFDGNNLEVRDPKYSEITKRADGFFIVTPEYNHSFPGTLKRFIDSELGNYKHKPVAFGGVSDGILGGARAIEALVVTVRAMELVVMKKDLRFPMVDKLFGEDGKMVKDKVEKYQEYVAASFKDLIWMAKTLKWGRENLS